MADVANQGKQVKIRTGKNFSVAEVGDFSGLSDYAFMVHGKERKGKVFVKEPAAFTSMEISFTNIPAGKGIPFVHHHMEDEEAYIFIQGAGRMQVDDDIIPVRQGSVVRVARAGKRSIGADADQPLVYICIQAREGSLRQYTFEDGVIDDEPPKV